MRGGGGLGGVGDGSSKLSKFMGEAWGQPPSLSVEIFHETRIWSNTKNP